MIDPHVVAALPPQLLQRLHKGCNVGLWFGIARVSGGTAEHGHRPNTLTLLRTHGQRPCCRCTAQKRDELASSHLPSRRIRAAIVAGQTVSLEVARSRLDDRPLWVKSRHSAEFEQCPLYPQKRTWISTAVMSALLPKADILRCGKSVVVIRLPRQRGQAAWAVR